MSTKTVKGLLKGLRYISKVFDEEEGEPEMQIGYPTDVKHVAHIGWDGPDNNNGPAWMNDFKPEDSSPGPPNEHEGTDHETRETKGKMNTSTMSLAIPPIDSTSSPIASPSQRPPDGSKKSRNRRHTPSSSIDSPTKIKNTSTTGGHRSSRRNSSSAQGTEQTSQDPNASGNTKKVRRRKKVSSEGGSTKSNKSKGDGTEQELVGGEFGSENVSASSLRI